ncbi:C-X-C motif chemokine 6-like [Toxotes jaculatrix]|uniref:C-X-C motif chemokine 6-like n=1 Tax=Toxotes jaculatrix TaxID=941984 RepID=UPI001B3AF58F|nr:C-X-C motif chemokine 6-like [Toxotes jaculatrix]
MAQRLRVNVQFDSKMKPYPQFVSLWFVLIAVRELDSTFVPGRCMCPNSELGVRGKLKELLVFQKSPSCNKVTVIVTLSNNDKVCLNPEAQMGRQLVRCWNRVHRLGRNPKLCLTRRRKGRAGPSQQSRQRNRGRNMKASSSSSL